MRKPAIMCGHYVITIVDGKVHCPLDNKHVSVRKDCIACPFLQGVTHHFMGTATYWVKPYSKLKELTRRGGKLR